MTGRLARRIAVFGPVELHDAVATCGFEPGADGVVAVVDATDVEAMGTAAQLSSSIPRVVIAPIELHPSLRAFGADPARIVSETSAAAIGPVLARLLPQTARPRTRVVVVTGVRGGVGRTLLATNVSRHLATGRRVCLVDATGSGAAAWWLRVPASSWTSIEGLADEMTPDHLAVLAHEATRDLHVIGGAYMAPSAEIIRATVRAAMSSYDIVLVDAPPAHDGGASALRALADRWLVLAYDEPLSLDALDGVVAPADWIIASQATQRRLGAHDVFRSMPRDETAVARAIASREGVRGRLGRAYLELAEILALDAS